MAALLGVVDAAASSAVRRLALMAVQLNEWFCDVMTPCYQEKFL